VVIGTLLVYSSRASVLFDSRASHSFISTQFVKENPMFMYSMKKTMLVSSPGGDMRATRKCPKVNLNIRRVDFEVDLTVSRLTRIDVILGIDWLWTHGGVIKCEQRTVSLTSRMGERGSRLLPQNQL